MKRFVRRPFAFWLVLIVASLLLLACEFSTSFSVGNTPTPQRTSASVQATNTAVVSKASTATAAPQTAAPKAAITQTPTAAPTSSIAKLKQRVVLQGVALTVNKADALDTYGGKKADTGYRWVVATVTVENASNAKIELDEEQFEYIDKDGAGVEGLLNGPSAPGSTGKDVFAYYSLMPGGKVENRTLPIQVKRDLVPGLQLMFTIDEGNSILVNLGFPTGPRG